MDDRSNRHRAHPAAAMSLALAAVATSVGLAQVPQPADVPPPAPPAPPEAPAFAMPPPPESVAPSVVPAQPFVPPEFAPPPAPVAVPFAPVPAPRTSVRQFFAGTLATVATATGATIAAGLTQAITGGLMNWFSRRTGATPDAMPAQPVASTLPPAPATPLPGPAAPPPAYAVSPVGAPQFFDPRTGLSTAADPAFFGTQSNSGTAEPGIYAGLAYEVHAIGAGGTSVPVDPASHDFRTGERFVVYYRPALPGRMEVYNINPAGQQMRIDSVELAAGQLATLGPYEFTALTGDEQLRLVLTPCSTPELLLATRDIVKVAAPVTTGPGLAMSACGPAMRSIAGPATRDIRKVALEETTAFALDPVSAAERNSGRYAPREVTILFRHR